MPLKLKPKKKGNEGFTMEEEKGNKKMPERGQRSIKNTRRKK